MPRRKKASAEAVTASEIPADAIGAVVLADIAQISADAVTHPDEAARERILKAVTRLSEIAQGDLSPALLAKLPKIGVMMEAL
jgi:hypothetical protein